MATPIKHSFFCEVCGEPSVRVTKARRTPRFCGRSCERKDYYRREREGLEPAGSSIRLRLLARVEAACLLGRPARRFEILRAVAPNGGGNAHTQLAKLLDERAVMLGDDGRLRMAT